MPYPGATTYPSATTYPGTGGVVTARDITITAAIDDTTPRVITLATDAQYVSITITETTGLTLSPSEFTVAFGSYSVEPTSWLTPDIATQVSPSVVQIKVLCGVGGHLPPVGRQWAYVRATDTPEIVPIRIVYRTITFA